MSLYNKIIDQQKLNRAWGHVRGNHPACGVDHMTFDEFEENKKKELCQLHLELENHQYEPMPVKEVTLYKGEKARKIALFCMRDKVVQQSLTEELSRLYDPSFSDSTYAYRPGRSALDAICIIEEAVQKYPYFLKLDIEHFFDNIDQNKLLTVLKNTIREEDVLHLIAKSMRAKALDIRSGELNERKKGVYQGSSIAPVLSNIYLMEFDRTWGGKAPMYIRYSDDILILGESGEQMQQFMTDAGNMLQGLSLKLQEQKSFLGKVSDGFSYLGYSFDAQGKAISPTAEEKLEERLETMWLTSINSSLHEKLEKGSEILGGWEQYYREDRKAGSIIEFAVLLYMAQNKTEGRKIAEQRFDYANVYRDLLEFFLGIWERWNIPDYQRKEYEQFHQLYTLDTDVPIDSGTAQHRELLDFYRIFTIRRDQDGFNGLIQIYSDLGCYNKAAFLQEEKKRHEEIEVNEHGYIRPEDGNAAQEDVFSKADIRTYMNLFVGREDLYAKENLSNGNRRMLQSVYEALTESVVKEHLEGRLTVSTYVQRPNATASYLVIDMDISKRILLQYAEGTPEFSKYLEKAAAASQAVRKCMAGMGIQSYVEFSGFRGYHLWLFFTEWIPLRYISMLQDYIYSKTIKFAKLYPANFLP